PADQVAGLGHDRYRLEVEVAVGAERHHRRLVQDHPPERVADDGVGGAEVDPETAQAPEPEVRRDHVSHSLMLLNDLVIVTGKILKGLWLRPMTGGARPPHGAW